MTSTGADRSGSAPARSNKNQNIQVFVRLRPINNREKDIKSIGIVEVSGNKDIVIKQPHSDNKFTKKFSFDRAFGPNSKQVDVYQEVVSPLIEEVLAGYNCTVFAYGQTGTGKTHTMVGESSGDADIPWQNDPMSGIIPRSLSQLFDELRITNSEYTVRVSYLELYNEELFDLLSSSEDNSKLRIYEDVTRKGSNIVNGLEEMTVYNKNEVYNIMAKGQEKRRTASTLMNAQSSRSHTVFTIVVHMKENSPDGEELMKIGKLNLVDLAGSENISKAGSDNPARRERARECVNINQSLLTLGRVITALVERHPHIPYRESKLTRLLQESLGGRTKTSIIATISPGHRDIEETLSTLEYAYRARNIQNKPEINQKMTKRAVLKEFSEEIDRLKRDLQASRERNGVYLANETYAEMTLKIGDQDKEIQEQILCIKAMREEKERIEGLFNEMSNCLKVTENKLEITNQSLDQTRSVLSDKKQELKLTKIEVEEHKVIVSKQVETEKKLTEQANNLIEIADHTTVDIDLLHNTVEKKRLLESNNFNTTKSFGVQSQAQRDEIKTYLNGFTDAHVQQLSCLQQNIENHHSGYVENQLKSKQIINEMFNQIKDTIVLTNNTKNDNILKLSNYTNEQYGTLKKNAESECLNINSKLDGLLNLLITLNEVREKEKENAENLKTFLNSWKDSSTAKILSLKHLQNETLDNVNSYLEELTEQHKSNHDSNFNGYQELSATRKRHQQEIDKDLSELKAKIIALEEKHSKRTSELETIENEKINALTKTHFSYSTLLQTVSDNLSTKMQSVNNTVTAFDERNKTFVKDMFTMVGNCTTTIENGASIDNELKNSVLSVSELNKNCWNDHLKNSDNVIKNINDLQTTTIEDESNVYNTFLGQCESKHADILQPIQSTLEGVNAQIPCCNSEFVNLQNSTCSFKEKIYGDLLVNDDIEMKFLTEEYKLYSPTGKTPVRRDYRYPKYLAATSPHERILNRYRNSKTKIYSPENNSVIEIDQTMESTPFKVTNGSDNSYANSTKSLLDDSVTLFVEPKPVKLSPFQNNVISKSTSDNEIYCLSNNDKQSKENLNISLNDKKDTRLRQPTVVKRVLGSNFNTRTLNAARNE